jgi:alpha-L-rhamnosidase
LTCDGRTNPEGIDLAQPRLGWRLPDAGQVAYQIRVEVRRPAGWHAIWDSDRIESADSVRAPYAGPTLEPLTAYRWQVRCWTDDGAETSWSEPGTWLTGQIDAARWRAAWISSGEQPPPLTPDFSVHPRDKEPTVLDETPALYLRKAFHLDRPAAHAVLVWCGLGYCEMMLDGERPVDEVLWPPFTDYTQRVLYRTADVTGPLGGPGEHVIGAILGNGFFNVQVPDLFQLEKAPWRQSPRLLAELHVTFADGSTRVIRTDPSWTLTTGPIQFNCIRGGETIEPGRDLGPWTAPGYDDTSWSAATTVAAPAGRLVSDSVPPIRVIEDIPPYTVHRLHDGRVVADFGGNRIGWTVLAASGGAEGRVTLRHGEVLNDDGSLNRKAASSHTYGRYQVQECVRTAEPHRFEPRFTYHAFRYVEAEGLPEPPDGGQWTARRVHTDLRHTGRFECSDSRLNTLHDASRRTLLDCAFSSPTAEAVREKVAWNGDNVVCMRAFFSLFDSAMLYRKAIHDSLDAQLPTGHVPPVCPTGGWGRPGADGARDYCDEPIAGVSFVEMALGLHTWYGDADILQEVREPALRLLGYLTDNANDGFVDWSLGDWRDAKWSWQDGPGLTPVVVTGTMHWWRLAMHCARICRLTGHHAEVERCSRLADEIKARFTEQFISADGRCTTGSQTAQALPLFYDFVDADRRAGAVEHLVRAMRDADGHMTAGFQGTMPVLYVLAESGYGQLAFDAVTKPSGPGWFWQLDGDRTTLGETLYPHQVGSSITQHHQFSACIAGWLHSVLGGIRPDKNHPGFEEFVLRPFFPDGLDWVDTAVEGPRGPVELRWERVGDGEVRIDVTVPGNSRTRLSVAGADRSPPTEHGPGRHALTVRSEPPAKAV